MYRGQRLRLCHICVYVCVCGIQDVSVPTAAEHMGGISTVQLFVVRVGVGVYFSARDSTSSEIRMYVLNARPIPSSDVRLGARTI